MYKMLIFLKKPDNPDFIKHFRDFTIPTLNNLTGNQTRAAKVESSLLIEQKYSWFCEVAVESKYEWDTLMTTGKGKNLHKDLMDFHRNADFIFVNYDEEI
jgi:hypothetical protein